MKSHLGIYSDWVEAAKRQAALYPLASPGEETRRQIRNILGFTKAAPVAEDVQLETTWKRDGLAGEGLSWSVGYGPRTQAWFLRPEGTDKPLPGVLALHGHDGFKFFGKEKIADEEQPPPEAVERIRAELYEGAAFANELARQGFAVLVHDVFLWGSRRFPFETMPRSIHQQVEDWEYGRKKNAVSTNEIDRYNAAAAGMNTWSLNTVTCSGRVWLESSISRTGARFSICDLVLKSGQALADVSDCPVADAGLRSCRRPAMISEQRLWSG